MVSTAGLYPVRLGSIPNTSTKENIMETDKKDYDKKYSVVAQWWSFPLLTGRTWDRYSPAEQYSGVAQLG